uniref:Methyltransferase n=1 Tax=viral metagenome TaxID=1070528 RepID=A0A6H1ZCV1_9ZZZZ
MTLITPEGVIIKDPSNIFDNYNQRLSYTHAISWHLTNQNIIDTLCKYSPVLSVGSGKGFTESIAKKNGCDIICTDKCNVKNNTYHKIIGANITEYEGYNLYLNNKPFMDIEIIDAVKAIKKYPDRNIFMAWCPYLDDMGYKVVKSIKNQVLIYIGEPEGGCTGDDEMFKYLRDYFTEIETYCIPQWAGLHDRLIIYKKSNKMHCNK